LLVRELDERLGLSQLISDNLTDARRGNAEQWIKEGKQAVMMTRLSCHRFRSNEAPTRACSGPCLAFFLRVFEQREH
jgi:hypothetical protein